MLLQDQRRVIKTHSHKFTFYWWSFIRLNRLAIIAFFSLFCFVSHLSSATFSIKWSLDIFSKVDDVVSSTSGKIAVLANGGSNLFLVSKEGTIVNKLQLEKRAEKICYVNKDKALLFNKTSAFSLVDISSGRTLWDERFPGEVEPENMIMVNDARIVFHGRIPNCVSAFDFSNGNEVWRIPETMVLSDRFVCWNNLLFLGLLKESNDEFTVCSLRINDGRHVWQRSFNFDGIRCQIDRFNSHLIVTLGRRPVLHLLKLLTGQSINRARLDGYLCSDPIVEAPNVYLHYEKSGDKFLSSLNINEGRENWCQPLQYNDFFKYGNLTLMQLRNELALVGRCLISVNPNTGQENWIFRHLSGVHGPFTLNDSIWVHLGERKLAVFDNEMNNQLSEFSTEESIGVPLICGDRVFSVFDNKILVCLAAKL